MNIFMIKLIAAMDATTIIGIVLLGLLLVALFVFPSFTNKKRQKQITELYKSVEVGDKIKTVGGIIGTVININEINALESEITLESGVGDNKTTLVFDMQAVYQNLTKLAQRAELMQSSYNESKKESAEESQEEPVAEATNESENA